MKQYDVIIIGAGAAGLFAAKSALSRGRRVAIFEMGNTPARKVMASGGGNCNITNADVSYSRYFGMNPNFVRGALSRVTPDDIIKWANEHHIKLIEKTPGRYFCADGANVVVDALMQDTKSADFIYNTCVTSVTKSDNLFRVTAQNKTYIAQSVIVATGGVSFPTLGVSDTGYKIAKSFGHKIVPVRPALCAIATPTFPTEFAGISLDAEIAIGKNRVHDSLLFTHFGVGGPAAYRASLHDITDGIVINLLPNVNLYKTFDDYKRTNGRKTPIGILGEYLPHKIAKWIVGENTRNIADIKNSDIEQIINRIQNIHIPANQIKLHGMQSAEVVRGGVDTNEVSSKTMESKLCPGIFWCGEVLDIAGDLGGFNLHWAWASGYVAGQNA
ncbi:MAG: aminoacetone oxidase family FAD-binding enzyme [Alphaproteobacteria bacterium]|nr:aminoacetone oxidase family FAD-binding enzyme [Alphaproteobacteria bacterium]MBR6598028.1 aminoacetone oxidase family FAD-binding enzyme [Alphaproteobacteria bacterium]